MLIGPSEQSEQSVRVGKFKQLTIPSGDFEVQETKGGVGSIMQCAALLALKEGWYTALLEEEQVNIFLRKCCCPIDPDTKMFAGK